MHKLIVLAGVCALSASVIAAPFGDPRRGPSPVPVHHPMPAPRPIHHAPPPPPPRHHHSDGVAVAAGIVGGAILGAAIANATSEPTTTVVAPAPTVITQPVVVQQPVVQQTVVTQPVVAQPVTTVERVWVDGGYVNQVQADGTTIRVYQPGHYEERTSVVR